MSTASWSTDGDQFQFPSPSPGYIENQQILLSNGDGSDHDADNHAPSHSLATGNITGAEERFAAASKAALSRFCPYSMRSRTLQNLPPPTRLTKGTVLAQKKAVEKQRRHIKRGPPCLDLLRKTLQVLFNVDIKRLLDKYRDDIIEPALRNIRANDESVHVDDEYPNMLIRQLLDDAKRMYAVNGSVTTPFCASPAKLNGTGRKHNNSPVKPTGLITSAESCPQSNAPQGSAALRQTVNSGGFGRDFITKRAVDSLSTAVVHAPAVGANQRAKHQCPIDIDLSTEFVTGSMANASLGYSHARGRIYSKHPEVFRYMPDAEDKQWLLKNDIIKSLVGKVFLLRLCDVRNLVQSTEYRTQAGVSMRPLRPFTLSDFMLKKMRESSSFSDAAANINATRADGERGSKAKRVRTQSSQGGALPREKSRLTGMLPLSPASAAGSSRRSDSDALGEDFVVRKAPVLRRQPNAVSDNDTEDIPTSGFADEMRLFNAGIAGDSGGAEFDENRKRDSEGDKPSSSVKKNANFYRTYLSNG